MMMLSYIKLAAMVSQSSYYHNCGCNRVFHRLPILDPLIAQGFIPPDDNPQTQVFVELPPGATLAQTRAICRSRPKIDSRCTYVKSIYTTIGNGSVGTDRVAGSQAAVKYARPP